MAFLCLRWRFSGQSRRTCPTSPHWKQRLSFGSRSSSLESSSFSFSFFFTLKEKTEKTRRQIKTCSVWGSGSKTLHYGQTPNACFTARKTSSSLLVRIYSRNKNRVWVTFFQSVCFKSYLIRKSWFWCIKVEKKKKSKQKRKTSEFEMSEIWGEKC